MRTLAKAGQEMSEESEVALGGTVFDTTNIQRISGRMRELGPIGHREAETWVKYWVRQGL